MTDAFHSQSTPEPAASPGGWLKLYRHIMYKPIWTATTPEQKVLLMAILMRVNYKESQWIHRGIVYNLKPGQMITSLNSLIKMGGRGVTQRKVRTALSLFEKLGFLTIESTTQNSLITIANWSEYQGEEPKASQQVSQKRQGSDTASSHKGTPNKKVRSKEEVACVEGGEAKQEKEEKQEKVQEQGPPPPKEKENEKEKEAGSKATAESSCSREDEEAVVQLYNQICTALPPVHRISKARRQEIQHSWKELSQLFTSRKQILAAFKTAFEKAQASDFLKGRNAAKWWADFDWLVLQNNLLKVYEGKYDVLRHPVPVSPATRHTIHQTRFHLPESRGSSYTNDQLEAVLLNKKKNHRNAMAEIRQRGSQ